MRSEILASGVIGAVIGGFLGALGFHVVESKRYMRKLETEVSKIKTSYEKKETEDKPKEMPAEPVKATPKQKEPESKPSDEETNQYRDKVSIYEGAINKSEEETVDYSSYSTSPKPAKEPKKKKKKEKDEHDPYPITDVDYYETFQEFTKVKATWWAGSHTLMDEDETILDVDATIGIENLIEWPEEGVRYIRNVPLGVDYEVTFVDSVYDYNLYD